MGRKRAWGWHDLLLHATSGVTCRHASADCAPAPVSRPSAKPSCAIEVLTSDCPVQHVLKQTNRWVDRGWERPSRLLMTRGFFKSATKSSMSAVLISESGRSLKRSEDCPTSHSIIRDGSRCSNSRSDGFGWSRVGSDAQLAFITCASAARRSSPSTRVAPVRRADVACGYQSAAERHGPAVRPSTDRRRPVNTPTCSVISFHLLDWYAKPHFRFGGARVKRRFRWPVGS